MLAVIGYLVQEHGCCDRSVGEIAGRAGVCPRLVQNAIRLAERLNLLAVKERRLSAFRNDTNVITVIDYAWRASLRLGGGCKNAHTTQSRFRPHRATPAFRYRKEKRLGEEVRRDRRDSGG